MRLALGLLALICSAALAQSGNPERALKMVEICSACHGRDGNAVVPLTPSLASQPELFLVSQMILFREGLRQVPAMTAVFAKNTGQDLLDLTAYFSQQTLEPTTPPRGARFYQKG